MTPTASELAKAIRKAFPHGELVNYYDRPTQDMIALAARVPDAGTVGNAMESGWLIERHINSEPRYWTGISAKPESFLPDSLKAIRFARQQDAAYVLSWLLESNGRATEHVWIDNPITPKPAPRKLLNFREACLEQKSGKTILCDALGIRWHGDCVIAIKMEDVPDYIDRTDFYVQD